MKKEHVAAAQVACGQDRIGEGTDGAVAAGEGRDEPGALLLRRSDVRVSAVPSVTSS